MDLDLSSDQRVLLSAIEPLLAAYRHLPQPAGPDYYVYGSGLDNELEQAGFYGEELERAEAALVLEQVAMSPYSVPAMASMLVAPSLGLAALPRPIALLSLPTTPARFLAESRTALILDGDKVLSIDLARTEIEPVKTIFAYPYARLANFDRTKATPLDVSAEALRDIWRLGLVFEILGALRQAHALTVDYVKQRIQFKRPIGAFQAVQHRLSEGATHIEALHYLGNRAAWSGAADDIALAAAYAQQHISQIVYDCHQFHGAMGVTLEYLLHHWTYRLKTLAGELGGSSGQARAATRSLWSEAA